MKRQRLAGTPPPMHTWVTPEGLTSSADAWGAPGAPQVLLQHGGGQTRHSWRATGALLGQAGYHAIALDARGHGDSDWSPVGDYVQDAFVRDLVHVVGALGNRRPALIGASLGGLTSLVAVGEGHLQATALVLVDIAPRTEPSGTERISSFLKRHRQGFDSLEEVADVIAGFRPGAKRSGTPEGLAKNVRRGEDGRYYWHWDPRFIEVRERELPTRYNRLAAAARRVTIPTLLVRGASSDIVSEEGVREFLELCPHAEYVNILDAGHMITGDVNDVFGRAAIDFLARAGLR